MDRSRLFRALRIAISAIALVACVLLSKLWVRSYSYHDILEKEMNLAVMQLHSRYGRFAHLATRLCDQHARTCRVDRRSTC